MSDYRIGIVVEGTTDRIVIESALNKILREHTYTLIQLQPEVSDGLSRGGFGPTGSGWGGVYQWCRQIVNMDMALADNLFLQKFDIIIIHLDADVAEKNYSDANIKNPIKKDLPCVQACPPVSPTIQALERVVLGWLNLKEQLSHPFVMCIPSKCTEAWVAIALYGADEPKILLEIECHSNIENYLAQKPARERLIRNRSGKMKKLTQKYSEKSGQISSQWDYITQKCNQADRFTQQIVVMM
ncbi:hypothetical protein PN36_32430 [Candidatus Thiomargarita nelsonii]|uniref:Uncharacterized protein n=1 Tax=Candidatus Thiomargarita nelsonii TaxID=1003181 RepID=A0A0A6PK36_9GAMM|nr:hypothetical protein PN36_32430 [Candidatus Thiomargarita nelsonii]